MTLRIDVAHAAPFPPIAVAMDDALALNNAHAVELSHADRARFEHLCRVAYRAVWSPGREGFLMAFDQDADYDSVNFLWFRERFDRFVYVDRIVVSAAARGKGVARQLYADLFATARAAGHVRIVCEVNSHPPNPASDAFHAALGFVEVGAAALPGHDATSAEGKRVRYLALAL
jgi:hypothetical protein